MPKRKYEDLSHLSIEEYKIEALKRRNAERKEYTHEFYLKNRDNILSRSYKKRLVVRADVLRKKLQELEDAVSVEKIVV
jgi:hypothetical protein